MEKEIATTREPAECKNAGKRGKKTKGNLFVRFLPLYLMLLPLVVYLFKYAVDKHTIDRCTTSDNVSKFLHGRIWIINYRELEKEIERRVEEGSEKKREKL